ncbi:MAG: hypothetical protein AAB691_03945 [Patescibacteria group bacterium]
MSTRIAVLNKKEYRCYADMLHSETPKFLRQVIRALCLRFCMEHEGDDETTWRVHWIETRWLKRRIATINSVPGFDDAEALVIQVHNPRYLAICKEIARRFERHFGLRAEITY